jgi:hypothetical protein
MEYSSLVSCGLFASFCQVASTKLDESDDKSEAPVEPAKAFSFRRGGAAQTPAERNPKKPYEEWLRLAG